MGIHVEYCNMFYHGIPTYHAWSFILLFLSCLLYSLFSSRHCFMDLSNNLPCAMVIMNITEIIPELINSLVFKQTFVPKSLKRIACGLCYIWQMFVKIRVINVISIDIYHYVKGSTFRTRIKS